MILPHCREPVSSEIWILLMIFQREVSCGVWITILLPQQVLYLHFLPKLNTWSNMWPHGQWYHLHALNNKVEHNKCYMYSSQFSQQIVILHSIMWFVYSVLYYKLSYGLQLNNIRSMVLPLILLPHKHKTKSSEQEQSPVVQNELQHKLKKQQSISQSKPDLSTVMFCDGIIVLELNSVTRIHYEGIRFHSVMVKRYRCTS